MHKPNYVEIQIGRRFDEDAFRATTQRLRALKDISYSPDASLNLIQARLNAELAGYSNEIIAKTSLRDEIDVRIYKLALRQRPGKPWGGVMACVEPKSEGERVIHEEIKRLRFVQGKDFKDFEPGTLYCPIGRISMRESIESADQIASVLQEAGDCLPDAIAVGPMQKF